ncbi:branched-chain amino acid ABC transporter permease [Muricoccus aerilatus]|uniref:branched-chain amino acid ABC transporter permease n=1 Tax=Muricoccus aerilatus TaxID=452982 RepID=UPI0005C12959|nr:branched-chain amino acid ABC transporter permease [Roseomonas aerilata]
MLELVPQLLFTGLGIGAIYALVALGFVLLIRAANVVNFAQGEFSMLGAYLMVILSGALGLPYLLSVPLAIAAMAAFGVLFAGATYWPLRHRGQLPVIISTIGASIFLSNIVLATYGPSPEVLPALFDSPGLELGGVFMDSQYIAIIVITALLVLLQFLIFERTLLGKKLQATSQDKEMASLLGIPVAVMVLITFSYSAALGGIAGVLVAPILFVSVGMGALISLKAFAANIIGGFGNIPGAILGGLALGVVETFGAAFISVPYKDAIAFALLLLFLLVRPQGLFGEKISEKA